MLIDLNFLNEVARELPIIRPIKEFIHLNLLLNYQHLSFWEALKEVGSNLEANPFPEISYYQKKIDQQELSLKLVRKKIEPLLSGQVVDEAMSFITDGKYQFTHHDASVGKLHTVWNELAQVNVIQLADGLLIKWLSMFLDQGIGHWQMPGSDKLSFYQCVRNLLNSSLLKPHPFSSKNLDHLFPPTSEEAVSSHLRHLCPDENLRGQYAKESLLTLRGWAGLIYNLQNSNDLLVFKRKIDLVDFLAVKLTLERAWIMHEAAGVQADFSSIKNTEVMPPHVDIPFIIQKACQETLEEETYDRYLKKILDHQRRKNSDFNYQVLFCMDDRESMLRHFLEETSERIETFGTAGHFGVECLYHHPEEAFAKKQCPAPVPAKVLLKELPEEKSSVPNNRHGYFNKFMQPSGNLLYDWFQTHLMAFILTLKLVRNLFFPLAFKSLLNVKEVELPTRINIFKSQDPIITKHGLPEGYTPEEMSDLVYQQLLLIGLVKHFSPLVFVIGHGSNSVNNPYYASYGCGACSGRDGAANARAFVDMSNNPQVRQLVLKRHGLVIPEATHFVAGFHDTCRDVIELYQVSSLPERLISEYKRFKKYLSLALYKNARERTKAFKLVTYRPVSRQAHKEVFRRSYSLFETRPELGHTNVTFAIVARREITRSILPSHPAFFQSYDPTLDPKGKLLALTLNAVIPVCSGINLDYYFSRVDNIRFGAGSKLPQNIIGNFGLSHGTESDLLFGLPFQMIDQHQPLRLFVLVDQRPQVALAAIQENPQVRQIVYNNWIHYACFDQETNKYHIFKDGQMIMKDQLQELT